MGRPQLASTRAELADLLAPHRRAGRPVGFVPTMGALHDGHAALMATARAHTQPVVERERSEQSKPGPVVVSIFVNPMQFGEGEDLDRYPRTLDVDLDVCAREGVDIVFAPAVDEVYPGGTPQVTVEPGPLGSVLEGSTRPGHYRGVLTVVAKLFGLVRPDVAVFGQKDYQQLVLIQRMVDDLCLGIDVVGAETVRESDGLALSSRNRYLDADQRRLATVLSQALEAGVLKAADGAEAVRTTALAELSAADGVDVDYLVVTAPDLTEAPDHGEGRVLVAAKVGATRLIDNVPVFLGGSPERPTAQGDD